METINTQELVIPEGVRETASEDGAVLLDIEQGICFSLNPVGLKIWTMLKKRYSVDQVADELSREFAVPRQQVLTDTREFINALAAKRLVRRPQLEQTKPLSWVRRMTSFGRAG